VNLSKHLTTVSRCLDTSHGLLKASKKDFFGQSADQLKASVKSARKTLKGVAKKARQKGSAGGRDRKTDLG